uniref:Uncharacterized protein n=1 Tax=Anguilla anguilla TaxID=7936 RepID=A0A0E9W7D0_ANGAN
MSQYKDTGSDIISAAWLQSSRITVIPFSSSLSSSRVVSPHKMALFFLIPGFWTYKRSMLQSFFCFPSPLQNLCKTNHLFSMKPV